MATKKATEEVTKIEEAVVTATDDLEELVDFRAPISREEQTDIFVCVNGESLQIQRGVSVKIPRKFYNILMQQQEMDDLAFTRSQKLAQGQ